MRYSRKKAHTFQRFCKRVQRFASNRFIIRSIIAILVLFIVGNAGAYLYYQNRTYPHTKVAGHTIGSVKSTQLEGTLGNLPLLPDAIELATHDTHVSIQISDLGISTDTSDLSQAILANRSWLPLLNLFQTKNTPLQLTADTDKLTATLSTLLTPFTSDPQNAKITVKDGVVTLNPEKDGRQVDANTVAQQIIGGLRFGLTSSIPIATTSIKPSITSESLQDQFQTVQAQTNTSVTLAYESQNHTFTAQDIANWHVEDGSSLVLSDGAIQQSVITVAASSFGIGVQNLPEVVTAAKAAVTDRKDASITLIAKPVGKTYNYCTAVRGIDASELPALVTKLHSVFTDSRGWSLGGLIRYQHATAGCDFTVWLSASNQIATFGAICDPAWSCRIGANVVINFDRWQGATTSWNSAGGNLEDYRTMVINHETGHWLGFYHSDCPGAGQPAPVMQQQSIDLQGCTFNPWPTANEQISLKNSLGL